MTKQAFTSGQVLTAAQMNTLQTNDYNWSVSGKTASYTLVAADVGTVIQMNSASATTITVNNSLFAAGDVIRITNIGAGTCTITAGTATVSTTGSLSLAQYGGGTLYFVSASSSIFFPFGGGVGYGAATGGSAISPDPTISGQLYRVLFFTSDGTLTVTTGGLFDVLMFGGGGGGGQGFQGSFGGTTTYHDGGGGGAGGKVQTTIYLAAGSYAVTVGAGGTNSTKGFESLVDTVAIAAGGGYGGANNDPLYGWSVGGAGGSGGGNNGYVATAPVRNFVSGQGFSGGIGNGNQGFAAGSNGAGGGGGAGAVGSNGTGSVGGDGGAGFDVSAFIGGSALFKGGGGGGGRYSGNAGVGGSSIGGNGASTGTGSAASANTASGGGGGYTGGGGAGGSGIVYVRFEL